MIKLRISIAAFFLAVLSTGCIENDIPYANVVAGITAIEAEGAAASIDADLRSITLTLDEETDIRDVNIKKVEFNVPSVKASTEITGRKDLRDDFKVTLSTRKDYIWTIHAEQEIERYFTVSGQVGGTKIDAVNRRAVTQVSSATDRSSLEITSLRLGPDALTTYSPAPSAIHDFTNGQEIDVTCHGRTETWSLFVEETETVVELVSADAWTRVAWLEGAGIEGKDNGFRYRESGEEEWKEVPDVEHDGGSFRAMLDSLSPLTSYECIAYCGDDLSEIVKFTTEEEMQMPNSGFETFSHAESDKYYSFYDPAGILPELRSKWWGTGNKGSTTVGSSYTITMPDTEDHVEGEASVKLVSQYVVIKFAAGNIFTGEYSRTIGTSGGVVRMGRPFTLRPRKLTFWIKYKCGKITEKTLGDFPEGETVKVGDPDRGNVWIALGTWDYHKYGGSADSPLEINTTDKSSFFNPAGPDVIAYGSFVTDKDINEWTKVEIPLEYTTTSKRPTHIVVSAAASMLGDYFTGSPDSILWLDDVRLEY